MGTIRLFFDIDNLWLDVIMDATLLLVFLFPSLYFLMLRPMEQEIAERKLSENELRQAKELLEDANREIHRSLEREQLLARTDGMTGLYNYRYFFELASREFNASLRYQRPLSIIIFDADHFKQINDTLGHLAGDKLLVTMAQTVGAQMRNVDVLARYGGDEFIILLPTTGVQQAFHIAERLRSSIMSTLVEMDNKMFAITLSIGVTEMYFDPVDNGVEEIVQRADKALYAAKQAGRNRTEIFHQE
jgi:two-component system, cell cycle response regulator